jgi:hypothetical protein
MLSIIFYLHIRKLEACQYILTIPTHIKVDIVLDYRYRGPGFDSRALPKKVVGLERCPLSLVSTTEQLLDRKEAAPV